MESAAGITRREFLKGAAEGTASAGAVTGMALLAHPERVLGASDRVRVAVCGLHGRGGNHLAGFSRLANVSCRLGRALKFDPESQQVIGDDEANALLRDADRGYRAPFTVPENV